MKKIFTLLVALVAMGGVMQAEEYKIFTKKTSLSAGEVISAATDPITVTSVYATSKNKDLTAKGTFPDGKAPQYFGNKISLKMRLAAAPSADTEMAEQSGNTAFKVIVKEALDSLIFYTEASGNTRNFHLFNNASKTLVTDTKETRVGTAVGGSNVGYITSYAGVQPGEYIFYNTNFGGGFVGIIVKTADGSEDKRPAAPISWSQENISLKIRDAFTAPTFNNAENLTVTFAAAGESATVDSEGNIALVEGKLGTTAVTATYEAVEGGEYKTTVATCTINVLTNVVVDNQPAPYTVGEPIEVAALYKGEEAVTAGATLLSDDNIEVTAPFASKLGNAKKNYLGQEFGNSIQVRAANAPSAENPNGTENKESTTLSVIPKTNLTLVVFGRRQTVDQTDLMTSVDDVDNNVITETHYWGYQPNDGKSLKTVCTEAPDVLLDNEIVLGAFDGKDYAYVAVKLQLEAGKTYTLFALGTTYQVNGIGYILPEPEAPEAPTHTETSDDNGSTFTFTYAEGLNLYYRYVVDTETPAPAAAPTEGAAETLEHEGETYNLLKTESLTFNNKGTLYYLAHNPATDARSEVQTVNVNGTTAIVEIGAEAEATEYYNLQGVRVANPENGLYIRKQGNTVTKVVL